MEEKYVIRTENGISQPMTKKEAIEKAKENERQGMESFIVSETEGKRIKENNNQFNRPKWE